MQREYANSFRGSLPVHEPKKQDPYLYGMRDYHVESTIDRLDREEPTSAFARVFLCSFGKIKIYICSSGSVLLVSRTKNPSKTHPNSLNLDARTTLVSS
jgi:hypothetical protein